MTVSVRLDTRELDKIAAGLNTNTDRVLGIIAAKVETGAKVMSPVDTGALRSSIHTEHIRDLSWIVADAVEYGIFQEYGTSRGVPPHPFMVPAAEAAGQFLNSGAMWRALFK